VSALETAYQALSRKDLSEREVRDRLEASGFSGEEIEQAIDRLERQGVLNDLRLARSLIGAASGRATVGAARLRARLESRGLAPEIVDAALEQSGGDEVSLLDELLNGRYANRDIAKKAQAGRFLLSRGFEEDAVRTALDRHFGAGDVFTE
jgi:regulatory protein